MKNRAAWFSWLERHHAESSGVWLILAKKGADLSTPSYQEAIAAALCFGWIDSQKRARDGASSLQRFSPRSRTSIWSKINVEKAETLIAAGEMRPAGFAAIETAKKNGRWSAAYASPKVAEVPADFQAALDANPAAGAFFETLSRANRYAILFRLQTVRNPETGRRKIEQFVAMLERKETIHPQKSRGGSAGAPVARRDEVGKRGRP